LVFLLTGVSSVLALAWACNKVMQAMHEIIQMKKRQAIKKPPCGSLSDGGEKCSKNL
jgi:hypothetical protein